jgi:hypothetical protein
MASVKSLSTNSGGHLYNSSKYAHFSQVTTSNQDHFPLFKKASPITIRVDKGECLTIPKKWWHHVKSFGSRCLSVNFWYDNGDKPSLSEIPTKILDAISDWKALHKWSNEYLIEKIDAKIPGGVWLIFDNFACRKPISVADFVSKYSDGKNYAYLITPSDFEIGLDDTQHNNIRILEILDGDFKIPFPEQMSNANANFWMNFGGLDTGLHFDDEDGLLCVIDGYKEVILYPPSDTEYLYPYPSEPVELSHSYNIFFYNLYKKGPILNTSVSMATLLEVCLHKAPNVAKIAKKLQQKYGIGKIVYGVKNLNGVVRYEFYFYGIHNEFGKDVKSVNFYKNEDHNSQWELSKYMEFHSKLFPHDVYDISKVDRAGLCIFSIDLTEEDVIMGRTPNLNLYYSPSEDINLPFLLFEKTYYKNSDQKVRSVVWTEEYATMFASVHIFVERCLKIGISKEDATNIINFAVKTQYQCTIVSIFNKGNQIGLYFFGIKFQPFLEFLDTYNYPGQLIELCLSKKNDIAQMNLEVGFHFEKKSQTSTPLRSAFYGVF